MEIPPLVPEPEPPKPVEEGETEVVEGEIVPEAGFRIGCRS